MGAQDLPIPAPSSMRPVPAVLSALCQSMLENHGLEGFCFPGNSGIVMVYDKGTRERLWDITPGIDSRDLATLLHVHRARCLHAFERGREAVRADLRHMLGVSQ